MNKNKTIFLFLFLLIFFGLFYLYFFKVNVFNLDKSIKYFYSNDSCVRSPKFIKEKIGTSEVAIDLTQRNIKGVVFLYNNSGKTEYYLDNSWEENGSFREYVRDSSGNIYLTPVMFLRADKEVFERQKNIYKIDSKTGKMEKFIEIPGNNGSSKNPYGLSSIAYDCKANSLFIGSLANSTRKEEKGAIYKIDIESKKITKQYDNLDALSLSVIYDNKGNAYIIYGAARNNGIYMLPLDNNHNIKKVKPELLVVPAKESKSFDKVYKIRVVGKNIFMLKGVEFNYTALASTNSERNIYTMIYDSEDGKFKITKTFSEYEQN